MGGIKVIIVGGGLAGALLANGLNNNGVDFTVYERDEANSKREGYQIRLGPGSQKGFSACLTDDHTQKIMSKLGQSSGSKETAPAIYNTRFEEILNLALLPSYTKSAAINRVVLRELLLEPIVKSGKIRYGKALEKYEIVTAGGVEQVKVHFSDGSSDICDILVAADGSNSRVNKQVGLNNIKQLDTHWSFLSKGSLPYDRMMKLHASLRAGPAMLFSKNVAIYYALYLPEAETAGDERHNGGNEVPLKYDEKAASFYWGTNIAVDSLPYKSLSEIKNYKEVVLDAVKDFAPEWHQMLSVGDEDSDTSEILVTQFRASTQPKADWRARARKSAKNGEGHARVWIMGDAIHAMQPNRGQGGNQALADCADILPQLLHLNTLASNPGQPTSEDISKAVDAYEAAMIPRVFEWVKKSGGASVPRVNLDGLLGVFIRVMAKLVMPILKFYLTIFPPKKEE